MLRMLVLLTLWGRRVELYYVLIVLVFVVFCDGNVFNLLVYGYNLTVLEAAY